MTVYTFPQLVALMKSAGIDSVDDILIVGAFSGRVAEGMAAIAMEESKGDSNAHNTKPPDDSYGLWQINMIGDLGPDRRKAFGIKSNDELFDPMKNAKAAIKILRSQGPNAWSTYKDGKYIGELKKAGSGVQIPNLHEVGDSVSDASSSVPDSIRSGFASFSQSVFRLSANAGLVLGAVVLLILAVVILMRNPIKAAAKKTVTVVGNATPVGRAASVAGKVVS